MITVWACQAHLDARTRCPASAAVYDTYADLVPCRAHGFSDEPNGYECEFMLDYIPADLRPHCPARPTVDIEETSCPPR